MRGKRQIHAGRKNARSGEEGSILIFVALSMTVVLGMMGLALDVGRMYATKQQAQAAADAAALAGALDLYNHQLPKVRTDAIDYAVLNGFNAAEVNVSTQSCQAKTWCNGHIFATKAQAINVYQIVEVTITRQVNTTFMRVLGLSSSTVSATADAAEVSGPGRVPIVALGTLQPNTTLTVSGGAILTICGGPSVALYVNSTSASSLNNTGTIDLSHAGPLDPGDCSAGTGAGLSNAGSGSSGTVLFGTSSASYTQGASPYSDPLIDVQTPQTQPATALPSAMYPGSNPYYPCPTACTVMFPGYYPAGIATTGFTVFLPGVYWIDDGGFQVSADSIARMATGGQTDPVTGSGMLIYNNALSSLITDILNIQPGSGIVAGSNWPTGDCPNGGICLTGSPVDSIYEGMLFFQNPNTGADLMHTIYGGSGISLAGTLYLTNRLNTGFYQTLSWSPGPGVGGGNLTGEILADAMNISTNITVNLGTQLYYIPSVALVN